MATCNMAMNGQRLISNIFRMNVIHRSTISISKVPACCCSFIERRTLSSAATTKLNENAKSKFNANVKSDLQAKIEHDPDVFGTLQTKSSLKEEMLLDNMPVDEEDVEEVKLYKKRKLTINQYGKIIKTFLDRKKVGNALAVLETRMLKEDKVVPDTYIYNLLISGCAKYGYTRKAFQLFNEMKKRGIDPSDSTYTSLFNACSTSPWPEDGLKRIHRLRELVLEKGINLNERNYHAMIKAYGRCGDIGSAFTIVDEMLDKKKRVTCETFNFLLQACASDKEAGFRHSLLVWRKMLMKGLKPDLFSFNLMLRCARDCGLGSLETTKNVIDTILGMAPKNRNFLHSGVSGQKVELYSDEHERRLSEAADNGRADGDKMLDRFDDNSKTLQKCSEVKDNCPDLLAKYPHLGDMIGLTEVTNPEHRLILIGGCEGYVRHMTLNEVEPDIKTISQLLEIIPSTISAEQTLLKIIEKSKIEPDIDFFNLLIKKRSMRDDYKKAKEVLKLIQEHRLAPDIVTFGVLSLSCCSIEEAKELQTSMDEVGYGLNIEILGSLLKKACVLWDCEYIIYVMQLVLQEDITPSPQFMEFLKKFNYSVNGFMKSSDKRRNTVDEKIKPYVEKVKDKAFLQSFKSFSWHYGKFKAKALVEVPPHPYAQFKKHNDPEDIELMNTGRK